MGCILGTTGLEPREVRSFNLKDIAALSTVGQDIVPPAPLDSHKCIIVSSIIGNFFIEFPNEKSMV